MNAQNVSFIVRDLEQKAKNVRLSVIVPTYNESENIKDVVTGLIEALNVKWPDDYEIIVVDDNSPDRTWKIVEELIREYPQVQLIKRMDEKGLSSAVIRGWQASCGEFLGVMDGDRQHPVTAMRDLVEIIRKTPDIDLIVASRNMVGGGVSDWSIRRRIISRGAQMLGLIFIPSVVGRVSDPLSGYFIVRRDSIAGKVLKPLGYKILIEVMAKGNIRKTEEVGYVFQERKMGRSKVRIHVYWEYILQLIQICFYKLKSKE